MVTNRTYNNEILKHMYQNLIMDDKTKEQIAILNEDTNIKTGVDHLTKYNRGLNIVNNNRNYLYTLDDMLRPKDIDKWHELIELILTNYELIYGDLGNAMDAKNQNYKVNPNVFSGNNEQYALWYYLDYKKWSRPTILNDVEGLGNNCLYEYVKNVLFIENEFTKLLKEKD